MTKRTDTRAQTSLACPRRGIAMVLGAAVLLTSLLLPSADSAMASPLSARGGVASSEVLPDDSGSVAEPPAGSDTLLGDDENNEDPSTSIEGNEAVDGDRIEEKLVADEGDIVAEEDPASAEARSASLAMDRAITPGTCVAPIWEPGSASSGNVRGYAFDGNRIFLKTPPFEMQFTKVATGGSHSLALDSRGNVWAWGVNYEGQVGNGKNALDNSIYEPPTLVLGPDLPSGPAVKPIIDIGAGFQHSVALTEDGRIYQWGSAQSFGNGEYWQGHLSPYELIPEGGVRVKFEQISVGGYYALALYNGTVYSWGTSVFGEHGHGAAVNYMLTAPRPMTLLPPIKDISAGTFHALALTKTGDVWAWGRNQWGETGTGAAANGPEFRTPVKLGLSGVKSITAGHETSWAIMETTNYVMGWGYNGIASTPGPQITGAFPGNANLSVLVPTRMPSLEGRGIAKIVAGTAQIYGITTDKRVFGWGLNGPTGQLGLGAGSYVATPVTELTRLGRVNSLAAGRNSDVAVFRTDLMFGLAVSDTGAVLGWGDDSMGQLKGYARGAAVTFPAVLNIGTVTPPNTGTVYFGDPNGTASVTGYTKTDFNVPGSGVTFGVNVAQHAAGTVPVYVKWGTDTPILYGCYKYSLTLTLTTSTDPTPAPSTDTATVRATVPALERPLIGDAVADFEIPALGGGLLALNGTSLTDGVPFVSGVASTTVKLGTPTPPVNVGGVSWRYPVWATARVGWTPVGGADLSAETVSNRPETNVRFVKAASNVFIQKLVDPVGGGQAVPMPGSEWTVYPDNAGIIDLTRPMIPQPTTVAASPVGLFVIELAPGSYWLEESKALQGFELLAQRVLFTVDNQGVVTLGTRATGNSPNVTLGVVGNPLVRSTIRVKDVPHMDLPKAGEDGPIPWLTLVGILLLAGAAVGIGNRMLPAGKNWGARKLRS